VVVRNLKNTIDYVIGWDPSNDIWEPIFALGGCTQLVEDYHVKQSWDTLRWPRRSIQKAKYKQKKNKKQRDRFRSNSVV
jgi:hypothetical protein